MAENCEVVSNIKFSSTIDESKFHLAWTTTTSDETRGWKFEEYYNVKKCVEAIKNNNFAKVALQFPDSLLCDASKVAQVIEGETNCKTFILADTSYGSCCIDEIAAEHVKADLIIHFGPACLSLTDRIPVLFVFGREAISIDDCCESFKSCFPDLDCKILVIYDTVYDHAIDDIYTRLASEYRNIIRTTVNCAKPGDFFGKSNVTHIARDAGELHEPNDTGGGVENHKNICDCVQNQDDTSDFVGVHEDASGYTRPPKYDGECAQCGYYKGFLVKKTLRQLSITTTSTRDGKFCRFGRTFNMTEGFTIDDYTIFYIGGESLTLTNHMMTYNKCQFYSYNPETNVCRKETLNVNRMLMKRYYLIERAKDSRVVGILVGTLGVANYLSAITRIKKILHQAGKKYYTFAVGKLNAEKLANFMEIDVFVLVACPENSLINSQEFYKPIVTPFEIEIACTSARQWTGDYISDFQELLPGATHYVKIDDFSCDEDDIPDISLISGQLRQPRNNPSTQQDNEDTKSISLVRGNQNTALSTQVHADAAEYLSKRSWRGLDPTKGETAVSKPIEGRKGIATEYTHEST